MKKIDFILVVILVVAVSISVVFATKKAIPNDKIVEGISNSYIDTKAEKKIRYKKANNNEVELIYKRSLKFSNSTLDDYLIYEDKNKNEYSIDRNKKLRVLSFKNVKLDVIGEDLSLDEASYMALEELKNYINIDNYNKIEKIERNKNGLKYYTIYLYNVIEGIKTYDKATITVSKNGKIHTIASAGFEISPEKRETLIKLVKENTYLNMDEAKAIVDSEVKELLQNKGVKGYEISDPELYFDKEYNLIWSSKVDITNNAFATNEASYIDCNIYLINALDKTISVIE